MTRELAIRELPQWSANNTVPTARIRMGAEDMMHEFKKRHGIMLILMFAWAASMMLGCCITGVIVRHNTAERVRAQVTSELRAGFQKYLDDMDTEEKQSKFLTGDASFEAAVEGIATPLSQVIATYSQDFGVTEEGLRTIGWVFCARYAKNSTEFGRTPQEILEKAQAWEGQVVGHATRPQDKKIATEVSEAFLKGEYPDGFTTALTFFTRETGGKIIARNELITGPYTTYWWLGK